jgi:hypothetical protein
VSVRLRTILLAATLAVAAAAALVLLNLVLLGSAAAESDPLGRLSPALKPAGTTTAPSWTVRPARPEPETKSEEARQKDTGERESSDD